MEASFDDVHVFVFGTDALIEVVDFGAKGKTVFLALDEETRVPEALALSPNQAAHLVQVVSHVQSDSSNVQNSNQDNQRGKWKNEDSIVFRKKCYVSCRVTRRSSLSL